AMSAPRTDGSCCPATGSSTSATGVPRTATLRSAARSISQPTMAAPWSRSASAAGRRKRGTAHWRACRAGSIRRAGRVSRAGARCRGREQGRLRLDRPAGPSNLNGFRVGPAVLASPRARSFPGAVIATLSIPWGFTRGDEDLGGYHLVWPRDLVETAGAFLAAGAGEDALQILAYLRTIQEADGYWPQNAWLDGTAYWEGIQMDECAFPILLCEGLHRAGHLPLPLLQTYMPMIDRAATFLVNNGPVTGEDRWEEDSGYSPFTLAVEIAALLAAADLFELCGRAEEATY